jgi:hypothetical protein
MLAKSIRGFMSWWEKLPLFIGYFFIPLVLIFYIAARIKNKFSPGDK